MKCRVKTLLVLIFGLLLAVSGRADTLYIQQHEMLFQPVSMNAHWQVMEDAARKYHMAAVELHPEWFSSFNNFHPQHPQSNYWLKTTITLDKSHPAMQAVLWFDNLTFADLYTFPEEGGAIHQQSGAFQPAGNITAGDSRFHFTLQLQPGKSYNILLKAYHRKGYLPDLHFFIQQKEQYIHSIHRSQVRDSLVFGGLLIFWLYALLSLLVSQFRPYGWLLITITGVMLFSFNMNGYFIDLLVPDQPEWGWHFNRPFIDLAFVGVFLLMIDFWHFKTEAPGLYRFGILMLCFLAVVSVGCFFVTVVTFNYRLTNQIKAVTFLIPACYLVYSIWHCWRRLNHAQRFLAYGIVLFVIAGFALTTIATIIPQEAIAINPHIANFTAFGVVLLFSIGLKEELRQSEIKRNASLQRLALLQKFQNETLEKKVTERTEELLLRNARIETLINELHHRVKNNLQLLYSLNQLQLPGVKDVQAQHILKSNVSKIKAMILVNQKLYRYDDVQGINIREFIEELAAYSERIYDIKGTVRLSLSLLPDVEMASNHILSFGLIVAELLTNAYKYAFTETNEPCIRMTTERINGHHIQFTFADNGPGLPPGRENVSMGLPLVKDLARQLNATIEMRNDNGLMYIFTIPV